MLVLDLESASFAFPLPAAVEEHLAALRPFVAASDPLLRPLLFPGSARAQQALALPPAERMRLVLRLLRGALVGLLGAVRGDAALCFDSRVAAQMLARALGSELKPKPTPTPTPAPGAEASEPEASAAATAAAAGTAVEAAAVVVLHEAAALHARPAALRGLSAELYRTQAWSTYLTAP